jgi:hypothetical protein
MRMTGGVSLIVGSLQGVTVLVAATRRGAATELTRLVAEQCRSVDWAPALWKCRARRAIGAGRALR